MYWLHFMATEFCEYPPKLCTIQWTIELFFGVFFFGVESIKSNFKSPQFCHILGFCGIKSHWHIYYIFHHFFLLEYGATSLRIFAHNNLKNKWFSSCTGSSVAVCESAEQSETDTFEQMPSKLWDNTDEFVCFLNACIFFLFCCCFSVFVFCLWMIHFCFWMNWFCYQGHHFCFAH